VLVCVSARVLVVCASYNVCLCVSVCVYVSAWDQVLIRTTSQRLHMVTPGQLLI